MEDFRVSLELRFTATVAGYEFTKDLSCASMSEAYSACHKLLAAGVRLVAARIDIDMSRRSGHRGCVVLDEESVEVFGNLCKLLRVAPETFWNETCGSYDKYWNRVTPADFGHQFPDGSFRIVWEESQAAQSLDECIRILKAALELLGAMQDRPYFHPTEAEADAPTNWRRPAMRRRTVLLAEAGCWPDSEDQYDEDAFENRRTLLDRYPLETASAAN